MIKIKDVDKIYKGKDIDTHALKSIGVNIDKNEMVAIIGKSGSGKSTLLNILGCMDKFDSGEYVFGDQAMSKLNHKELAEFRNSKIGFVFQNFNLVNEFNVQENVEMPLGYAGIKKKERREKSSKMLEKVGILDKALSYPNELSGGQQQRVAIARALINNPELILADEPTGNLDSKTGEEIMLLLKQIHEEGATIIIVTHDSGIAKECDREIVIHDGRVS